MMNAFYPIEKQEVSSIQNTLEERYILSDKEIEGSLKLVNILSDIHNDMEKEGYDIIDGKVFFGGIQVFKPVTPKEKFY